MKRLTLLAACLLALAGPSPARPAAEAKRPMKLDDLFRLKRVSDPQVSPDGKAVAYVVAAVDLEGSTISSSLWLAPTGKGEPKRLTNTTKKDRHPRWSPDGKHVLFESNRSGTTQLWLIAVGGGEARQLTKVSTGASNGTWSPDGKAVAFVSAVHPEFSAKPFKESAELSKRRDDEAEKGPVKAKVFTKLFYRHWDSYAEGKREHLFVAPFVGGKLGEPKDVTPGDRDASPTSSTFSVGDDFIFSPDGKYLLYTAPPEADEAWSTNYDVWRVPAAGGERECLTKGNDAGGGAPRVPPDGKGLAHRAQKGAGFEADRWQIYVVEADASGAWKGKPVSVTAKFDGSANEFVWSGDGKAIYFTADHKGVQPVFKAGVATGEVTKFIDAHTNASLSRSA